MSMPTIRHVRAFIVRGGGADYHDQPGGHWIDDHISTTDGALPRIPPERQSFASTCWARWWSKSRQATALSASRYDGRRDRRIHRRKTPGAFS